MRTDADARRATLYAALGFCQLAESPEFPEITAFKAWMSTWRGIGDVVTGMERQGYALSLRKLVDDGWNAAFEEHRLLAPARSANAPTPFKAVIDAAWVANTRAAIEAARFDAIVAKPVDPFDLCRLVLKLLGRRARGSGDAVTGDRSQIMKARECPPPQ
jgi:hypothetical protein